MLRRSGQYRSFTGVLKENWWVFLVFCITFSGCIFATSYQNNLAQKIQDKINILESKKKLAVEKKDYLQQMIQSKDDPDFISLTLIKVLGVIPEGQKKVIFTPEQ